MTAKKDTQSFQKAFEEFEQLVQEFEKGDMDLDESLQKFEHGLMLASFCRKKIQDMEQKVVEIKKKFQLNQDSASVQDDESF
jgi:exodeoxyribonuclease VII small subunit